MKTATLLTENFIAGAKTYFFLGCLAASLFLTSCKQGDKTQDGDYNGEMQTDSVAAPQNNDTLQGNNDNDKMFLTEAAIINMEEIELGKLAQNRASTKDVKDFGKMMVDGHTKSLNELKDLAAQKGISLPQEVDEKGKNTRDELTKADAKSFEEMYIDKMVTGHKDAISKFETERDNTSDADIKAWTVKTLPDLQMHLDHAIMVQKKIE
jgi:putative membrane protein